MKTISFILSTAFLLQSLTCGSSDPLDIADSSTSAPSKTVLISDLKTLLQQGLAANFQEDVFDSFVAPFQAGVEKNSRKSQRILRVKALNQLGPMTSMIYLATNYRIQSLSRTVSANGVDLATCDRVFAKDFYLNNMHPYFLLFQTMVGDLLNTQIGKPGVSDILQNPYGISSTHSIAWLKDSNGTVPIPLNARLNALSISHLPLLYGDWGDKLQRSVLFTKGQLITSPGLYVEVGTVVSNGTRSTVFKYIFEQGAVADFKTFPISLRTTSSHPATQTLLRERVFLKNHPNQIESYAFLPLPENGTEEEEFNMAFLEELVDTGKAEDKSFAKEFLKAYALEFLTSVPVLTDRPEAEADQDIEDSSTQPLITYKECESMIMDTTNAYYREQIRLEQEEISRQVREGTVQGRLRKRKLKSGTKPKEVEAQLPAATGPQDEQKGLNVSGFTIKQEELLNKIKERGRIKWRTLIKVLNAVLKDAYTNGRLIIEPSSRGSHVALHLSSAAGGKSDGITIVRPHGKSDPTMSAGEARNMATELMSIAFKLMHKKD